MWGFSAVLILGFVFSAFFPDDLLAQQDKSQSTWVQRTLHEIKSDAPGFYRKLPRKSDDSPKIFARSSTRSGSFVKTKQRWRRDFVRQRQEQWLGRSVEPAETRDLVEGFVDVYPILDSLQEIESRELLKGEASLQPWSDHYWPIYSGVTGLRYADPEFPSSDDWKTNFDYVMRFPLGDIFKKGITNEINRLSPAEKYDLLLGSKNGEMTQASWREGKLYYDRYGKVERWMGICHGWAPAAYRVERPRKSVDVLAADGKTQIRFYPSDIKALASLLWAKTQTPVRFLGSRCNDKEPKYEDGRLVDPKCFDTNPGVWHLTVVNQMGLGKKSFILDATYDYEVWNQPIRRYQYAYFNPQTMEPHQALESAQIALKDFRKDRFKKYRGSKTQSVVGVVMQVEYMTETLPEDKETDSEDQDQSNRVVYAYDLELDEEGRVLGGEWYSQFHPDFLWTPAADAKAITMGDYSILSDGLWSGKASLPEHWRRAAQVSHQVDQPLGRLVESLVKLSQ